MSIRRFHTSRYLSILNVKGRINTVLKKNQVITKTNDEVERKKIKESKKFRETPVQNASAKSLLTKLLDREFPDDEPIGPTTALTTKELLTIFKQDNIRLTYKVLGTSGRQIQDSLLVDNDVKKLLARDDLLRAKQLAKMARFQGLFAYGTILQYFLNKGQVNDAFEIFMDLKKRGYKLKGRLYNILISGYGDCVAKKDGKAELSQQKIEQLYRAFQKDHHDSNNKEISIILVNSLLKVLRRGKRLDLAIKLYDSLRTAREGKLRLRPDIKTYTEMLRILSLCKPTEDITFIDMVNKAEQIFYNAQHITNIKIDLFLLRAYSSLFVYSDDLKLRARSITILREWFRLSTIEEINETVNPNKYNAVMWEKICASSDNSKVIDSVSNDKKDSLKLLPKEEINFKKHKRFEPDEAVLRMYSETCKLFKIPFKYKPRQNQDQETVGKVRDQGQTVKVKNQETTVKVEDEEKTV